LVGRLQYSTAEGTWNEWHALFDGGSAGGATDGTDGADGAGATPRSAWLSEDNGAYVLAFEAPLPPDAPPLTSLRAGQRVMVDRRPWDVASVVRAKLLAAQGELPHAPRLQGEFSVVDLRNTGGEVGTLDGSDMARTSWSIGRSVALSELRMSNLADGKDKTLGVRSVECPSCGSAIAITLASTKSVSCGQCKAVVDVSSGVGADMAHYAQNNSGVGGLEPQIPLGRIGNMALAGAAGPWQVVGYQERCSVATTDDDEVVFWREYLLYNRLQGFAFLVDSNDGWSAVRPTTGAPTVTGNNVRYAGALYRERETYAAQVTWVQGEFYWRVQRGERALVTDYEGTTSANADKRLSREQSTSATGGEVVWSAGAALEAADVAKAFGLAGNEGLLLRRDATPTSGAGMKLLSVVVVIVVGLALLALLTRCSDSGTNSSMTNRCAGVQSDYGADSAEYRQCVAQNRSSGTGRSGGGSYGGWSSGGGGHK
jgi:hypothetical protein